MNVEFEDEYVFAPDPDDPTFGEGLKEACRKDEERELGESEERFMCRSILAKILLSCDQDTLTKAKLNLEEKEFIIAYDFWLLCYRDSVKSRLKE